MDKKHLNKNEIISLAAKVSDGIASDEELSIYLSIINHFRDPKQVWTSEMGDQKDISQLILSNINRSLFKPQRKLSLWMSRAAACLAFLLVALWGSQFIFNKPSGKQSEMVIVPGGTKASLTLSDGRKITLNDKQGIISNDHGINISTAGKGLLDYHGGMDSENSTTAQNILYVPKGGTYEVRLSDGTHVWLNSDSKLTYPVSYGARERVVELEGEAYFEVTKEAHRPFVVKSRGQSVTVLGTHFNINAYQDEPETRTTLLEGAVRLSSKGVRLNMRPMQQSISYPQANKEPKINDVQDGESAIAWKNGNFQFQDEDLKSIMRKISKWYDVEVSYQGDFEELKFDGIVSRNKDIRLVLMIMEATGNVHFTIEGRRVIVKP